MLALLGDPARAREQTDMLTNYAAEIVARAERQGHRPSARALLAAFDAALQAPRGRRDAVARRSHAGADRAGRPGAHRRRRTRRRTRRPSAGAVALPAALLADVRAQAARADREITDGYERQAVITAAAYLLEHAGLGAESDALAQGQPGARATRRTT